jgi:hypothetical protein
MHSDLACGSPKQRVGEFKGWDAPEFNPTPIFMTLLFAASKAAGDHGRTSSTGAGAATSTFNSCSNSTTCPHDDPRAINTIQNT